MTTNSTARFHEYVTRCISTEIRYYSLLQFLRWRTRRKVCLFLSKLLNCNKMILFPFFCRLSMFSLYCNQVIFSGFYRIFGMIFLHSKKITLSVFFRFFIMISLHSKEIALFILLRIFPLIFFDSFEIG